MKAILFTILFSSVTLVHAQNKRSLEISGSLNTVDPVMNMGQLTDSRITDGGNHKNKSIATGLTLKYFIAENSAIRIKAIYTKRNNQSYRDISTGAHSIYDIRIHQELFKLAPGIQWSMQVKKISFFGGFELPLTFLGEAKQQTYNLDENLNGTNQYKTNSTYTVPGGTSFGLGFFAGTNFYIIKKLALGFELGSAYEYTSVGGTLKIYSKRTGPVNSESYDEHEETIKQMKFAGFQAGINIVFKLK